MSAEETKPQTGAYTGEWYQQRNERRKEKYHTDPEYRETANKLARDGYRENHGKQRPFDPRDNLPALASFGTERTLDHGEMIKLTFSKAEVAAVFNRPVKQIQQWAADGRIPASVQRAKVVGKERNWIDIYHEDEVRAMVEALGPFLADLIYFRCDHVDAIKAVHEAVAGVRNGN